MFCIIIICNSVLQQGLKIYNGTDSKFYNFLLKGQPAVEEQMSALSRCLGIGLN